MSYLDTDEEDSGYLCPVCGYEPTSWEVAHIRGCPQCRDIRKGATPDATHYTMTASLVCYFKKVGDVWHYNLTGGTWREAGQVDEGRLKSLSNLM